MARKESRGGAQEDVSGPTPEVELAFHFLEWTNFSEPGRGPLPSWMGPWKPPPLFPEPFSDTRNCWDGKTLSRVR